MFFRRIPVNRLRLLRPGSSAASSHPPLFSPEEISPTCFSRPLLGPPNPIATVRPTSRFHTYLQEHGLLGLTHKKAPDFSTHGFFCSRLGGVAKGGADLCFSSSAEGGKRPDVNVEGGSAAGSGGGVDPVRTGGAGTVAGVGASGTGGGSVGGDNGGTDPVKRALEQILRDNARTDSYSLFHLLAAFVTGFSLSFAFYLYVLKVKIAKKKKEVDAFFDELNKFLVELNMRLDRISRNLDKIIEEIQVEK